MAVVDCHAHWIPDDLARLLRERRQAPRIDGDTFVTWQGRRPVGSLLDAEKRVRLMDRYGIAFQVLSLGPLFGIDCLPPVESLPLVRSFNDATAELCRSRADRFAGLAALPTRDMRAAITELQRAHGLGLRGAALPADAFRTLAEAQTFRPLFAAADRTGSHLFIHPGPAIPSPERDVRSGSDNAWQRRIALETQASLSDCVVTLACSDFLDPYPGVTVQIANLGGTIPFLLERMETVAEDRTGQLRARLRRCYVDTASFGPRSVGLALDAFGPERVLFGTDCPIFSIERMLDAATTIAGEARHAVLEGNAHRLFLG